MPAPLVSVITTTHNGERFLAQTIESVLRQTLTDFEYLIVDDASSDGSPRIITEYAARDGRILSIRNSAQLGPAGALNRAVELARGSYLANLDHDDLAMPKRLELQSAFLEHHPSIGVVGACVRWINGEGRVIASRQYPTGAAMVRWGLLFRGCIVHSTAMMRRDLVRQVGGYSTNHPYASDYELWTRLLPVTDLTNLPHYLAAYRRTEQQTSRVQLKSLQGQLLLLRHALLYRLLGIRVPLQAFGNLSRAMEGPPLDDTAELMQAAQLLKTIRRLYLEREKPEPATVAALSNDCALKLSKMAQLHPEFSSPFCATS